MSEKAFAYATAHRDQLRSPVGRAEVRAWLRQSLAPLGEVRRLHRFHIDRPGEQSPMNDLLTDDLRSVGYMAVGVTADVERKQ